MSVETVRRVIVIDDNAAIHGDFQKILMPQAAAEDAELEAMAASLFGEAKPVASRLKYRLSTASQGQEGVQLVKEALAAGDPIQVAFVDIRMPPGWDGIETIEHLWKIDPDLQTVICSAYSDYSWDAIHARLGDSDRLLILKKPFDTAEIAQLAAALTEKYRLARVARFRLDELDRLVAERTRELQSTNEQLNHEVNQRRAMEERLRHDVLHDRLTGLPNRAMLIDRIEQCLRRRKRDANFQFALLFIDMDDFKVVNDSLGHDVGDKLLIGIGQRLAESVRALDLAGRMGDDLTSRLGGDEFVLLLDGIRHPDDATLVAQRIEAVMAQPFDIDGHEIVATLSIGIACGHSGYESASEILRDADTAVYRVKRNGKHNFVLFDSQMHEEARRRLELEGDLRRALAEGNIVLHYQPLVCLQTGEIRGFEALVRLKHPQRGLVGPSEFVPVAEETGLIIPMGFEVLREACRQVHVWRKRFAGSQAYRDLRVAVNLAAKQLRQAALPDQIDAILAEFGLEHSALELEITENVVMEQGDSALETLNRLRERGYIIAIDDFGTGYSSLSHLHRIPIHIIKIDQSFVRRMSAEDRSFSATVQAVVTLAHNCGLQVIGEGIETLGQLVQLQELECDMAQGYWFSKPVPAGEAEALLRANLGVKVWNPRAMWQARAGGKGEVGAGEGVARDSRAT